MALTSELQTYYANLLILQYRGKAKARATVKALAGAAIMDQLPVAIQDCWDVESAVGVQLDVIGKYSDATRYGYDFSGAVTLGDDDFRKYIKIKISQNSSGSSLSDIQSFLKQYFDGVIEIFDHKSMRVSYFIDSNEIGSELAEFFAKSGALPKPMGVQLSAIIYLPTIDNMYGFVSYGVPEQYNTHGFNTYAVYDEDCPWLIYDDCIPSI